VKSTVLLFHLKSPTTILHLVFVHSVDIINLALNEMAESFDDIEPTITTFDTECEASILGISLVVLENVGVLGNEFVF
jgi:hypothetical protein